MTCAKPFPNETCQAWPAVRRLAWIALAMMLMVVGVGSPVSVQAQATGKMRRMGRAACNLDTLRRFAELEGLGGAPVVIRSRRARPSSAEFPVIFWK